MARSAGSGIQLVAKTARTPCSACRPARCAGVLLTCRATVGQVGNVDHQNINWGKAGRNRWKGSAPPCAVPR